MAFAVFPQLAVPHNKGFAAEQGFTLPISAAEYREGQVNCGAAGGAGLANFSVPNLDHLVTHHEIRLKSGNPGYRNDNGVWIPTGLGTQGVTDAINKMGGKATRYSGVSIWTALDALKDGMAVGFCVDYPTINAFRGGIYSGDRRFDGPHFLVAKGARRRLNHNEVGDWDSILDGRPKKAYTILTAPVWVPFRLIRLAAGNFRVGGATYNRGTPIGVDKGIFIVAEPAP